MDDSEELPIDFKTVKKDTASRRNCAVPLCFNHGRVYDHVRKRKVTYHRIPKDQKEAWLSCIKRRESANFKVTQNTFVCSQHFEDEDMELSGFSGRWKVLPGCLPTIFNCWEHKDVILSNLSKKRASIKQLDETPEESTSPQPESINIDTEDDKEDEALIESPQQSISNIDNEVYNHNANTSNTVVSQQDEKFQQETFSVQLKAEDVGNNFDDIYHMNKNKNESTSDLTKSKIELIAEVLALRQQLKSAKLKIAELEKTINEMDCAIVTVHK